MSLFASTLAISLSAGTAEASSGSLTLVGWLFLVVLAVGVSLLFYCIFTIYRNPYFSEVQKMGWLLLVLAFPLVGPCAWLTRARLEKKFRESADYVSEEEAAGRRAQAAEAASRRPVYRQGQSALFAQGGQNLDVVTTDSPENPYLVEGKNGARSLNF